MASSTPTRSRTASAWRPKEAWTAVCCRPPRSTSNRAHRWVVRITTSTCRGGCTAITSPAPSVRPRQPEAVLGNMVQDHLAADRHGLEQPDELVHVGQRHLSGEAGAAVHLDRLVEAADGGVGGQELGHVAVLTGVRPRVIAGGRVTCHQPRSLKPNLGLRQRVCEALVSTDRYLPDPTLAGIGHGLVQRIAADTIADGGNDDPFGVHPVE